MEVYHPHKVRRHKKIKDFIFEFFMMFLAITGGFFMENLREHSTERHKEREYIESLAKDVTQDTISIREIILTSENQVKGIDSLTKLLKTPVQEVDLRQMYRLTMIHINKLISFTPNEITITQLKNSSGMRLIGHKQVSDSIIGYYSTFDSHIDQQKLMMNFLQETLQLEIDAMDFGALTKEKQTFTFDQSRHKEFFNRTILFSSLMENEIHWMKNYQKQSISLLKLLKKEYKLE